MNSINMRLVKVNGKTRKDLFVALVELGEMDCDFNGENGTEYLWYNVNENKYESNMEYLLDTLEAENDKDFIEQFVSKWIGCDSYYKDYILNVIFDKDGKAECIALATMS